MVRCDLPSSSRRTVLPTSFAPVPSLESSGLTVNLQVLTPGAPNDVHPDDGKSADGDRVAFCKRLFDASSHLCAVERSTVGVVEEAYNVGAGRLPDDQQVPA